MKNIITLLAGILICAEFGAQTVRPRNASADWPMYNRDYAGTRYSPLNQINTANVANLTTAWSYKLRREGRTITALSPNEIFQEVTPIVYKNVVLMGSNFYGPGMRHIGPQLETSVGQRGDVSAFDVRTGKKVWEFHTIPHPGETGIETWGNDSWKNRTGNNVWAFSLTLDEQRGILYLPVSEPGANFYGGDRPGK